MQIAIIVDKYGTAIDRLSQSIYKYNPHLDIQIISLHPKSPSLEEIKKAQIAFESCDILHVAYWRSGEKLKEYIDLKKWESKPKVLCHYNPYDVRLTKEKAATMGFEKNMLWSGQDGDSDSDRISNWDEMYDIVVVGNESMRTDLPGARLINYGVDLNFFAFNEHPTEKPVVNMVVARIEGKKGVKEVAKACAELNYDFELIGRISDGNYYTEIMDANPNTHFHENISDEELREKYYSSMIHVCNSVDNYESGTLPILESMATGVCVLTRNIGHVPDLYDGQNLSVRNGEVNDIEEIKAELKALVDNPALRNKMREKSWETVKNWSLQKYALQFEKLYYELYRKEQNVPFCSIIIPTKNRHGILSECLAKVFAQDYPYIEVVIVDSSKTQFDINSFKANVEVKVKEAGINDFKLPVIKYIHFDAKEGEYTLPKARNIGVLESSGELLIFCDDRIGMESNAVSEFARRYVPHSWSWGIKDDAHKGFVENFSCISRKDLVENGMFNERIDTYGGTTQDIRERMEKRASSPLLFRLVGTAKARSIARTSSKGKRRKAIINAKFKIYKLYQA